MKGKLALLGGLAVGYVLGTRDGRERFEQIKGTARSLWNDPAVQQKMGEAQEYAKEKAPEVQQKVMQTAQDTVGKVTHRSSTDDTPEGLETSGSPSSSHPTGPTGPTG